METILYTAQAPDDDTTTVTTWRHRICAWLLDGEPAVFNCQVRVIPAPRHPAVKRLITAARGLRDQQNSGNPSKTLVNASMAVLTEALDAIDGAE